MADTFALSWAPTEGQLATRGGPTGTYGPGLVAELANQPVSGNTTIVPGYISHAASITRRGVDLAVWNEEDSGKVLKVHRVDTTWARADNAAATPYESNLNLVVSRASNVEGGESAPLVCLDTLGQALPSGVSALRDATATISTNGTFRRLYPAQVNRLGANVNMAPNAGWCPGSTGEGKATAFRGGLGGTQPIVVNENEAVQFAWKLNPSFYLSEHEYTVTFTDGTHTWIARIHGMPFAAPVLVIANATGSGKVIEVISVMFTEGHPFLFNGGTPTYNGGLFMRGIDNAYLNNGYDMTPVALSGATWPAGIRVVPKAGVDHVTVTENPPAGSDFLRPYMTFPASAGGYAKASLNGLALPGPTPNMMIGHRENPLVIRPGEGFALDTDNLLFTSQSQTGATTVPVRVGFLFTVEDAPAGPSGGGEHAHAYVA